MLSKGNKKKQTNKHDEENKNNIPLNPPKSMKILYLNKKYKIR